MLMSKLIRAAGLPSLALLLAGACSATPVLYEGEFDRDDFIQQFLVTLEGPATLTARTLSFAGGTSGATTVVSGGFLPILTIFLPNGDWLYAASVDTDTSGDCGPRSYATGYGCWDAYFSFSLSSGTYLVALTQYGNQAGITSSDPFSAAGRGNFTGPDYIGQPGRFIQPTTFEQRTGDWAVEFDVVGSDYRIMNLPEPASLAPVAAGLVVLLIARRRVFRRPV